MDCSICLEPIADAFRTACGHDFHKKCFLEYQAHCCAGADPSVGGTRFLTCPNCKRTLFKIQAMDLESGVATTEGPASRALRGCCVIALIVVSSVYLSVAYASGAMFRD